MKLKNKISIHELNKLVTLINNSFITSNAALDLDVSPAAVSIAMTRLMGKLPDDFFVMTNRPNKRRGNIIGVSPKYSSVLHQINVVVIEYRKITDVLEKASG